MQTALIRTSSLLDDCEKFLKDKDALGSVIESYLVQHALVVLCAEMQQEVYSIADSRAAQSDDEQMQSFISSASKRVLRSVRKDELAAYVGFFGKQIKQNFNCICDEATVAQYNNAVDNRHKIAHQTGVQVTLREVRQAVGAAKDLLDAINKVIRPDPTS